MTAALTTNQNVVTHECEYLAKKHGFTGMVERMTTKYKLIHDSKSKDNIFCGMVSGINITIINGKHNNRSCRKVLTDNGRIILFSM